MAINYLKNERKLTDETIEKHNLGYTEKGFMRGRIIVPSYNSDGNINYYVGRAFLPEIEPAYMGLKADIIKKGDIIFNESNVNFDLPVYLVEGVFDMFPIYNAVPLLGKKPPYPLIRKLIEHKSRVIICLDGDAIRDSLELYNKLLSYGIDVYFVEIKDDIAKHYETYGKESLLETLQTYKKIDLKYLIDLKTKNMKKTKNILNKRFLEKEWLNIKNVFENLN